MDGKPLAEVDDADIILRMMDGDQEGLRLLLRKYGGKAKGYLTKRYGHVLQELELDDAVNRAAFSAWRRADSFDDTKGSLGAWFLRIAQNAARDVLREEQRHKHAPLEYAVDDGPGPDALVDDESEGTSREQARLVRDLDDVTDHLPPLQKAITEADRAAGGAADSVRLAAILGTSVNSVRVSRNKARQKIRSEMLKRGHFGDARETTP